MPWVLATLVRAGHDRRETGGKMMDLGKILVVVGLVLLGLGLALLYGPKIPWLGQLPGDIIIKREKFTIYFPLATSLILSVILTLLLAWWRR